MHTSHTRRTGMHLSKKVIPIYYAISNELYHHGIKGQKWGVRRFQNPDGTRTSAGKKREASDRKAENYSSQQRKRDQKIYGKGAEKRINKRMLEGESVQSARHNEVERKARIDNGKKIAKTVAKGALVVGGAAAVTYALQKKGLGKSVASEVLTEEVVNVGRHVINGIFR